MYDLRRLLSTQYAVARTALCGFCLAAFSLTSSAGTALVIGNPAYTNFRANVVGNTAMLFYGSGGTPLPSASTLAQHASVAGLSPTAGEVSRYAAFSTKYGQAPFKVAQRFTVGKLAAAAAALAVSPALGIGLAVAAPFIADWFEDGGVTFATDGSASQTESTEIYRGLNPRTGEFEFTGSLDSVCGQIDAAYESYGDGPYTYSPALNNCNLYRGSQSIATSVQYIETVESTTPISPSSLASAIVSQPRTLSEIESILVELSKHDALPKTDNEPAAISPPDGQTDIKSPSKQSTSQKTNSDGSTAEEVKNCWIKGTVNLGHSMTMTEVCNTDTTVKGTSGTVISTSTSVTTAEDAAAVQEEKSGFCESLVGKLVCADLDTPDAEPIEKTTKTLTYAPEDHFGGGACPADAVMTMHNGQTLKVWDWMASCDKINQFFRPLFLTLCAFTALMILAPAVKEA